MGKISELWQKLKSFKHLQLTACAAALVVVLGIYFSCAAQSRDGTAQNAFVGGADVKLDNQDYCIFMQTQLENVVSKISGVGSAAVVINWDRNGRQSSFVQMPAENPKPIGALVVCDGGNSTKVKLDVIYAVSTLLDLSYEKIAVYPKSH